MAKISIMNVLGFMTVLLTVSACSSVDIPEKEPIIEVKEVPIEKPAPIVPTVEQLKLKDVDWVVITEKNYEEIFEEMKQKNQNPVIFGLSGEGYENLALNINDLRSTIQQYQTILAIYEKSYE